MAQTLIGKGSQSLRPQGGWSQWLKAGFRQNLKISLRPDTDALQRLDAFKDWFTEYSRTFYTDNAGTARNRPEGPAHLPCMQTPSGSHGMNSWAKTTS